VYVHPNTLGEVGVPVHLAVGYEMALDLLIFVVLIWLARGVVRRSTRQLGWGWQSRYPRDGMIFWTYLCLYSAGRFVIEFYRQDTIFALGISQAQLLAAICTMIGIWMLVFQATRRSPVPAELSSHPG
jgi:prolipoprotein diacylglyceryltransferase